MTGSSDSSTYSNAGSKMSEDAFIKRFGEVRCSAILRCRDTHMARVAMQAAMAGGFTICEFTFTIPGVLELISEFAKLPGLIVGAGTVLTREDAQRAVDHGASFLVSPVVDAEIIAEAKELGVAMMPGCATPTEMLKAHRAGASLQKLFPAPGTGPLWVAQTIAPMPFLRIVPTSGVTLENAVAYLKAGSFAVGFVSSLFDSQDLEAGRFEAITKRAANMIAAVKNA